MARKSRRTAEKTAPIEETAAVGYIRLSVANKDESCSIENQKHIIELWAERHQMPLPRYYIDENVSGSTFERDGFKEMVSDIERGVIGCVIVKDLSRLGRDLITTSYYVEEYFPSKKVRFASINDQFDTFDGINNLESPNSRIRIPLVNTFNEQTSVDIRKKTQTALDMKAKRGMFIGPRAPYGYKKSEANRFQLVPDPEVASIVKVIFELASTGAGIPAIARYLNEQSIPTPIQYARSNGLEGNYDDGDGVWNTRSVKYILTNRTYTGVLVQGVEKRVVEGTHTPLVSTNVFDAIQKTLQQQSFHLTEESQESTENILKGKVICGNCGSKMQRRRGTNHANWYFYTCLTNNRVGANRCTGMYVREEDIFSAIYYQLKLWIEAHFISNGEYEAQKASIEQEIAKYTEILAEPAERIRPYYEQYIQNKTSLSEFRAAQAEIHEAKERLDTTTLVLEAYEHQYQLFMKMNKVRDKKLPLSEIVDGIEKIVVDPGRHVDVKWSKEYSAFACPMPC